MTIGAWTARPKTGTADIDPYSRAAVARSGELPIGSGDGVAFIASTDDKDRPLDGRCDVVVSGVTPAARFWTLTLYDTKGQLVANSLQRYGFTSQEIVRSADGAFEIRDRVALARRQLAADRRPRPLRADDAALRYAGRRRHAHAEGRADAARSPRWAAHDPLAVRDHRRRAARRHRASGQRAGAAAHRDQGRLFAAGADDQGQRGDAAAAAEPGTTPMPFMDPAFATAVCRYDLSAGPIKLTVPVSQAYTSVSFYTRNEVAYYAINDRSAGRRVIELDLMTEAQHAELPEDEEVTAADRLIIESPTATGLIVMKALAAEPGLMPQAQASLAASSCRVQTEPPAPKQAEAPPPPPPAPPHER